MIFTKITIDNLYSFKDTEIDFTLKRTSESTIDSEHLSFAKRFKYKKVCILSGANASGKTSFGRVLCGIQNYLERLELIDYLEEGICNKAKTAQFSAEVVTVDTPQSGTLHYLNVSFRDNGKSVVVEKIIYASTRIQPSETNFSARVRLQNIVKNDSDRTVDQRHVIDYVNDEQFALSNFRVFSESLNNFIFPGWHYSFAQEEDAMLRSGKKLNLSEPLLSKFLRAFDPTIKSVERLGKKSFDGLKIIWQNEDTVSVLFGKNGEITNPHRMSSGTREAVMMTTTLSRIKEDGYSAVYYIDEQMAYCHSEMEQAVLNLLVDYLSDNAQLFYTTHNFDIIELNFPVHSHYIFKKEANSAQIINVHDHFKKNDRGLLNYVKNNAFRTLPDTSGIDDLLFE